MIQSPGSCLLVVGILTIVNIIVNFFRSIWSSIDFTSDKATLELFQTKKF